MEILSHEESWSWPRSWWPTFQNGTSHHYKSESCHKSLVIQWSLPHQERLQVLEATQISDKSGTSPWMRRFQRWTIISRRTHMALWKQQQLAFQDPQSLAAESYWNQHAGFYGLAVEMQNTQFLFSISIEKCRTEELSYGNGSARQLPYRHFPKC